eukprot:EG_transcript_3033
MDAILRRYSADDITSMMGLFQTRVMVRDRRVGLKVHHNCFVGQEAVTVIAIEFGLSRYEALLLGRVFESRGQFRGVGKDKGQPLRDAIVFYRFTESQSPEDIPQDKAPAKNLKNAFGILRRKSKATVEPTPLQSSPSSSRSEEAPSTPDSCPPTPVAAATLPQDPRGPIVPPPASAVMVLTNQFFQLPGWQQAVLVLLVALPVQLILSSIPLLFQALVLAAHLYGTVVFAHKTTQLQAKLTRPPPPSQRPIASSAPKEDRSIPSPPTPNEPAKRIGAAPGALTSKQKIPIITYKAKYASDIKLAHQSRDYLQLAQLSEQVSQDLVEAISARREPLTDQQLMEMLRLDDRGPQSMPSPDCRLLESIAESRLSFLLSDPRQPGNPIIYASRCFREFTGYSEAEIRDLNTTQQLHGPETSMDTLLAVQQAIIDKVPISIRLRLYKKDRTPFWCQFYIQPLFAADGAVDKWLAIHIVTEGDGAPELLMLPRNQLQPPDKPIRSPDIDAMVRRLGQQLRQDFPNANLETFDNDFLAYVASKPGRTYEYCIEKLRGSVQWRIDVGVDSLTEAEVLPMLMSTEMFWHRFDNFGRPVLYLRPAKQDMNTFDRQGTFKAIVYTMEQGLKLMPPGVVTCILVIDAEGVGWAHFDTQLTKHVLSMASVGFRDRVDRIVVGPTGVIVSAAWKFVRMYVSENLKKKIHITNTPATDLAEFINPKDIPHHVFKA